MPKLDYDIEVYNSTSYKYVRISDLKEEDRGQLERWIFGYPQPLIYLDKHVILDAVFHEDYLRYLQGETSPLTSRREYDIIKL